VDPATTAAAADRIGAALARVRARADRTRAERRIDTVASVVNHDLSNPLTIADGYLDVVMRDGDTDHLDAVADGLDRIDEVSDAAVTIARQGRPVDDPPTVPLHRLVDDAWRDVEGGTLAVDEATVVADPDRLLTVFERLFDNAVRHCDDPTVVVRATDDAVIVADDGPGIPPDRRDRVADSGYSTVDGRPGLGLTVVEWLATAHGWSLSLGESERGGLSVELSNAAFSEPSA
jgi:signal transduction histidine kinase